MNELWLAEMPDCFGYGLMVIDTSEKAARNKLMRAYRDRRKGYGSTRTFDDAMDYFDGSVRQVQLGKVYNDGFQY